MPGRGLKESKIILIKTGNNRLNSPGLYFSKASIVV